MSFKTYTLGKVASNTSRRFNFKNKEQVCFVNTGDILDGHFLVDEKVSSIGLPGQAKKAIQKGDILYSEIRPGNKRHLLVNTDVDDYVVSTKFMVITCNQDIVIPEYLYLVLTSKECEAEFKVIADSRSGTFPQITFDAVAYYPVELPSLIQQRAVVEFIKSITGKLNLNNLTNQTLEEMAQAIFKSWFVDFDPVKAKMNGEQPQGMDEATASLFPDKLVESELGLIPEGWQVSEAKHQLNVLRGFSYKGSGLVDSIDEGVPMHNLNSVLEGGGYKYSGLKYYSEEYKDKFDIQVGDVLVANTEQGHDHLLIGYGAMVPKRLASGFFSHHIYRVRPKSKSNVTPEFIEQLFSKGRFVRQVQGFTNGTTVNMLPITGMEMPQFVVPPLALTKKYSALAKTIKAKIEANHQENIELAKLRDLLLPKLLSGEIEVEQADVLAEVS